MAASLMQKFKPRVVSQSGVKCTASIIFFHGTGDSGKGIEDWLSYLCGGKFEFPHIRTVFPTAPVRPMTYAGGAPTRIWFDRLALSPQADEDDTVHEVCAELSHLIEAEVQAGIPKHRILLGGFSMGGGLSLHLGYRFHREVAGVVSLSSFLQTESAVYKALQQDSTGLPPLFQCHGTADELVPYSWGEATNKKLKELGVKGDFHPLENLDHQMTVSEITMMRKWILERLPDVSSTL